MKNKAVFLVAALAGVFVAFPAAAADAACYPQTLRVASSDYSSGSGDCDITTVTITNADGTTSEATKVCCLVESGNGTDRNCHIIPMN